MPKKQTYYKKLADNRHLIEELTDLGVMPYTVIVHLNIYEKHQALKKLGHPNPTKEMSRAFLYTDRHIRNIINKMSELCEL